VIAYILLRFVAFSRAIASIIADLTGHERPDCAKLARLDNKSIQLIDYFQRWERLICGLSQLIKKSDWALK